MSKLGLTTAILLFISLVTLPSVTLADEPHAKAKEHATAAESAEACVTDKLVTDVAGIEATGSKEATAAKRHELTPADANDLAAFTAAVPAIEGGVAPWSKLPIRNQCAAEICWAYSLNEFVDGFAQQVTGDQHITSADHNGFWHLYAQFFNHKGYFNQLRKKVESGKMTKDEAIREANLMLSLRQGSTTAREAGYVVNTGSNESIALLEAGAVGFVPDSIFDHAITSDKQSDAFQNALNTLIGEFLSDKSKLDTYTTTAADGINDDLYNLLGSHLQSFYGGKSAHPPYRPNDTFPVGKQTYTPLTYMTNVLKFNPNDYSEITMTQKNQNLLLQAVNETLLDPKSPKAVPIGFTIYNQELAEKQGIFADNTLLPKPVGGHEIVLENILVNPKGSANAGTPVGLVAQNSWDTGTGLTVDGKPSDKKADTGYYGFTLPYLLVTTERGEPPSFMLPKSILEKPEYSSLR